MPAPARVLLPALAVLAFCLGTAQAAKTYKWVDEDGVTHYSQHPPPEGEAQVIEPSIGVPSDAGESPEASAAAASEAEGGDADAPQTVEGYCKQLREQAQMLASERDVRIRREDGTLEPLAGDARAARRAEIAQQIDRHCN